MHGYPYLMLFNEPPDILKLFLEHVLPCYSTDGMRSERYQDRRDPVKKIVVPHIVFKDLLQAIKVGLH
jgi:hypothetical protein